MRGGPGDLRALVAVVDGVTAAAIGAISGAVVVLAKRSVVDVTTTLLAIATAVLLLKVKKLPEPALIAIAAIIGIVVFPGVHR